METVFLGLGSNQGDSVALLGSAISALGEILSGLRASSLWRSRARYVEDQPDFLNAVVTGSTELSPRELLRAVNGLEERFGRRRDGERRRGPRPLDIDILLHGSRIVAEPELVIPHAGLRERKFALLPLLELEGGLVDPVSGLGFLEILAALPPQGIYLLGAGDYDGIFV